MEENVHIRLQTLLYLLLTYLSDDGATSFVGNSWATEINGENRSERMHCSSIYLQSKAVGRLCHWETTLGFLSQDLNNEQQQQPLAGQPAGGV